MSLSGFESMMDQYQIPTDKKKYFRDNPEDFIKMIKANEEEIAKQKIKQAEEDKKKKKVINTVTPTIFAK